MAFNFTISGYPLTMFTFLVVSLVTSTLTTKTKEQDRLRMENEKVKMRADLLRSVSHDIRTPMNAIMGMATIAKAHVDERERILDCMEKINGASKLLLSLINEVLDMSKIESGRLILSEDEFNVGELLQDLVVMMQPEIKNKQQTLNIHVKNLRHENVKAIRSVSNRY